MILGQRSTVANAYANVSENCLTLGNLCTEGVAEPDIHIRIPLDMVTRHMGVFGSSGSGKTKSIARILEQFSDAGIAVFVPDVKSDLSGMSQPGDYEKVSSRVESIGQAWFGMGYPVEYFQLGEGPGVALKASVDSFGATNLSRMMSLTAAQKEILEFIFMWCGENDLPLLGLNDLLAVVSYLMTSKGREHVKAAPSSLTVIQRKIMVLQSTSGQFFGGPDFNAAHFLRQTEAGRGVVNMLELGNVSRTPEILSVFLYWLMDQMSRDEILPEIGDGEVPKFAMIIDEAHLLFESATKEFILKFGQLLRLLRSKGCCIILASQYSSDIPTPILDQLGSTIQHAVRANSANDALMLKKLAATYPKNSYDLPELIPTLAKGHAVVKLLGSDGSPLPVAWAVMQAPQSQMTPVDRDTVETIMADSDLKAHYQAAEGDFKRGAAWLLR